MQALGRSEAPSYLTPCHRIVPSSRFDRLGKACGVGSSPGPFDTPSSNCYKRSLVPVLDVLGLRLKPRAIQHTPTDALQVFTWTSLGSAGAVTQTMGYLIHLHQIPPSFHLDSAWNPGGESQAPSYLIHPNQVAPNFYLEKSWKTWARVSS